MERAITLKQGDTTIFTDIVNKVVTFFKSLKTKTNNLSSTKVLSLEDEVERLHYILTSSYKLEDQNQILTSLINKIFDNRQDDKRALEASLASLKTSISKNPNLITEA